MKDSEGSLQHAEATAESQSAEPLVGEAARDGGRPASRQRAFTAPPPDPAEALYYEGMAAYQHRNWEEAWLRFSRLKELQPTRPGLDALLDEVRWFLQLQATAPSAALAANGGVVASARPPRRWQSWLLVIPAAIGILALLLIAFGGHLPWLNTAERGTQELYNRGQARLAVGDYEGANAAFKKLLEVSPNDPEAQLGLKRAERQQTLAQGYAAAEAAIAEENWDKAAAELDKVLALDSSHAGAQAKADFVAQRRRLTSLYADSGRLYDLGQWQQAITQFQKIRELDSSYRVEAVNEFLFSSYLNVGQAMIAGADNALPPVQGAVEYFSSALAIKPRNRQAADARRLGGLYLDALRSLKDNSASEAQSRLEALLAEDATYAGGQAARLLYDLLLKQAEAAVKTGDITASLRFYQTAEKVPVADHKTAIEGAAFARSVTPTSTSSPAPSGPAVSPTASGLYAVVRGDSVNVRAGPGQAYGVLSQARGGERLTVSGRNADSSWFAVCMVEAATCPADQIGWVAASLVDASGLRDALPAITPPTPPAPTPATARPTTPPANQVACIQGHVLDTRGGEGLNGWTVAIQGPGLSKTYRPWNKGAYQFANLVPGTYTVAIEVPGGWQPISPSTTTVTVTPSADCVTVDFWNEREARAEPPPPR